MKKIKYVYKLWNTKNKTEKYLIKMLNNNTFDLEKEKHLMPLIKDMADSESTQDMNGKIEIVLTRLKECKDAHTGLKMLYICHETINVIKTPFSETFLLHDFQNLHYLKSTSFDVENYVSNVNSSNYYNFLLSYATYLKDLEALEAKPLSSILDSLYKEKYEVLIQLITLKNLVKYGIKVNETLQTSINFIRKTNLIDKIAGRLYKDLCRIYNLMSRCLAHVIFDIFKLSPEMIVLLDEFYCETILVTKKMKTIVFSLDEDDNPPELSLFEIIPDFNKKEELFVLALTTKHKIEKPYLEFMKQYQTVKHIREDSYCTFKLKKAEERDIMLTDSAFEYDSRFNTVADISNTHQGQRISTIADSSDDLDVVMISKTVLVNEPEEQADLLYQSEKIGSYTRKYERGMNIMKLPKTRNPKVNRTTSSTSAGVNTSFSIMSNKNYYQSNDYSSKADL